MQLRKRTRNHIHNENTDTDAPSLDDPSSESDFIASSSSDDHPDDIDDVENDMDDALNEIDQDDVNRRGSTLPRSQTTNRRNRTNTRTEHHSDSESRRLSDEDETEPEISNRRRRRQSSSRKRTRIPVREQDEMNLREWHPQLTIDWSSLASESNARFSNLTPIPQPSPLNHVKMLPYQLEGLQWFLDQEEGKYRGGILADEMGMGKTLQMISLLVSKPLEKTTLIVCPVVALIQWSEEIAKYTPEGYLKVAIYHGADRTNKPEELLKHDIILTTYAVVESCFRKQTTGFTRQHKKVFASSVLHAIHWGRIILDEAHSIKDRSCSTARAVFALTSDIKWALSGTPVQFLTCCMNHGGSCKIDYYFCKKCPCKSMTWRFRDGKTCDECGHKPMQHFCWYNKVVLKPIQKFGPVGEGKEGFERLRTVLDQIMLRRTKLEKADDLKLPPRVVEIRRDFFNEQEQDFYEALYSESRTKFASYVRQGTVLNNYAHIFELLSKLRQAADHPFLVVHKQATLENPGSYVCGLCHDVAEDPIASRCKHVFCREDIRQYIDSYFFEDGSMECPVCFTKLAIDLTQVSLPPLSNPVPPSDSTSDSASHLKQTHGKDVSSSIVNRMLSSRWTSSTKLESLLDQLHSLSTLDRTIKSIVFSQFVSFLDIVYWRLRKAGIQCVKLDGRMTPQQRDAVIKSFMNVPQVTVFLVSLKAGGVALNLTEASRIFILDPWWNPAVEDQAMDRIHRLGQHRSVHITRMIVENSIESRIVQLQEKKKLLFQSTVGKDAGALERLTEEDLLFLFQM